MSDQAGKKLCPKCRMEIDSKASICPHCKSKLSTLTFSRKLILILLIPVFVSLFVSLASDPTIDQPVALTAQEIINLKKHDFHKLSNMNVEMMLKSPSTAKFNTSPTVVQDPKDPNSVSIESWVDSQNGFGAMVRSYWSAKGYYVGPDTEDGIGTGENWKIKEFIFDGQKVK